MDLGWNLLSNSLIIANCWPTIPTDSMCDQFAQVSTIQSPTWVRSLFQTVKPNLPLTSPNIGTLLSHTDDGVC